MGLFRMTGHFSWTGVLVSFALALLAAAVLYATIFGIIVLVRNVLSVS